MMDVFSNIFCRSSTATRKGSFKNWPASSSKYCSILSIIQIDCFVYNSEIWILFKSVGILAKKVTWLQDTRDDAGDLLSGLWDSPQQCTSHQTPSDVSKQNLTPIIDVTQQCKIPGDVIQRTPPTLPVPDGYWYRI